MVCSRDEIFRPSYSNLCVHGANSKRLRSGVVLAEQANPALRSLRSRRVLNALSKVDQGSICLWHGLCLNSTKVEVATLEVLSHLDDDLSFSLRQTFTVSMIIDRQGRRRSNVHLSQC